MKRVSTGMKWALFLVLAGIFLLLKNLGVFRQWGDAVWGGIFVVGGIGFLIWYLTDLQRWWRSLAGFALLASGVVILLQWRQIELGDWTTAILLLGVALGFWAVLIAHRDMWWSVIPAGVLTVLAVLVGLQAQLTETTLLAVFFVGLGAVFCLVYLIGSAESDTHWAAIPAAALLLLGLVTWVAALNPSGLVGQWWPVLLVAGGLAVFVVSYSRWTRGGPVAKAPDYSQASRPAPGASVTVNLPPAEPGPAKAAPGPEQKPSGQGAAPQEEIDIYSLLAQQPPEPGSSSPAVSKDVPPAS